MACGGRPLVYYGDRPHLAQDAHTLRWHPHDDEPDPGGCGCLAIVALWFYRLDEPTVQRMGVERAERRKS